MEFQAGGFDNARHYLEEFVKIRKDNEADFDGDYVNVLFMIGNIHKLQGNGAKAKECWSEAYEVFQELGLAEENPQIARVMDSLLQGEKPKPRPKPQPEPPKSTGIFGSITNRFKEALREEKMPKYGEAKKAAKEKAALAAAY